MRIYKIGVFDFSKFERITRFDEYFEYTFWDDTSVESEN